MNVTLKQKEALLNSLKRNPELITGRIDRKCESRLKLAKLWDEIAQGINSILDGPQKSGKEWAKTWRDMKSYILKKEAKRRSYLEGTGGGPPPKVAFSPFEDEVLQLLSPEAAGLENIPEGGIYTDENPISDNIIQTEIIESEQDMQNYMMVEEDDTNEGNSENISPYSTEKRGNVNTPKINNTTRGKSVQRMSHEMLKLQQQKLKLKKMELILKKKKLKVQKDILSELRQIKTALMSWTATEALEKP